ncbi:MAG: DUF4388 domain-containing protein [Candidatus Coatesbacteria bacterium]|nr:MAG: DUF4388 domain-containing protein [Candidatus Coatesbacteria bacterium]
MLAFEGRIDELPIPEVIHIIEIGRKTGMLIIEGAHEQVTVYFKDGKVVYANPTYQRERIGNIMVKQGVVTREVINKALTRQRQIRRRNERVRIGTILLEMGAIDREQLANHISSQITESIYISMAEKKGRFKFLPGLDLSPRDIFVEMDIQDIICEGMYRADEWEKIIDKLPDFGDIYALSTNISDDGDIKLANDEWKILSLINGRRSINAIIEKARLDKFEVCKSIYNFVQLGLIKKTISEYKKVPVETIYFDNLKPKLGIVRRLIDHIRGM